MELKLDNLLDTIDSNALLYATDEKTSTLYTEFRKLIVDYKEAIEKDSTACGLGFVVASKIDSIDDFFYRYDDSTLKNVWEQSKSGQLKLFDLASYRIQYEELSRTLPDLAEINPEIGNELELMMNYILQERCKDYDLESFELYLQ